MKSFKSLALGLGVLAVLSTAVRSPKAEAGIILMGTTVAATYALSSGDSDVNDLLSSSLKVGGAFLIGAVAIGGIISLGDNANAGQTFKYAVLLDAETNVSDVEGVLMAKYPFLDDAASLSRLTSVIMSKVKTLEEVNHVRLSQAEIARATASANLSRSEMKILSADLK